MRTPPSIRTCWPAAACHWLSESCIEFERRGLPIRAAVNDNGDRPFSGAVADLIACARQRGERPCLGAGVPVVAGWRDMHGRALCGGDDQQDKQKPCYVRWHAIESIRLRPPAPGNPTTCFPSVVRSDRLRTGRVAATSPGGRAHRASAVPTTRATALIPGSPI